MPPSIAFANIGQAPRDDIVPELLHLLGAAPGAMLCQEFGALDGLSAAEIAAHPRGPREGCLYTRLADGTNVIVGAGFVARRLERLMRRLDGAGFDLIVLITTGVFQPMRLRTPVVHGQRVVDSWIAALVMGDCELGLIYPLPEQHRGFAHGTLIQNARAVDATGEAEGLGGAAARLGRAELILMHSVGYTEAMAQQVAVQTGRPVVTARRIIAGAMWLHLADAAALHKAAPARPGVTIQCLPDGLDRLTPREHDVLTAALDGQSNKSIGRHLGISHRTVEIHRARALAKLGAASPAELIRRALIAQVS